MAELFARVTDGSVLPEEDMLATEDRTDLEFSALRAVADRRFQTGIMVVSLSSGNILYLNQTPHRYLYKQGKHDDAPFSIFELIGRMIKALPGLNGERSPIETKRLTREESFLLLRSFGTYDAERRMSRAVVTIDKTDG